MIRQGTTFHKFAVVLLSVAAGGVINSGWAQTPVVEDNVVKTAIYFPMPFVTYNSIYLGKKLDLGITKTFRADLGSTDCTGVNNLVGTGRELPSLWLPNIDTMGNEIVATPLIVRSQKPDGTALSGRLDVSGLSAPIFIRELEVGKRSSTGTAETSNFALLETENSMGGAGFSVTNLVLGDSTISSSNIPELESLTVTGNSTVSLRLGNSASDPILDGIPECTDGNAHWQKLKFNGTERTVLACGDYIKEPFDSGYECLPNPGHYLKCDVNSSNNFYCSTEGCSPAPAMKWREVYSQSWNLSSEKHQEYCTWLHGFTEPFPADFEDQQKNKLISLTHDGSVNCSGGIPSTEWQSFSSSSSIPSSCIYIRRDSLKSISCLEDDVDKEVTGAVPYDIYGRELFTLDDCQNYCNSFN